MKIRSLVYLWVLAVGVIKIAALDSREYAVEASIEAQTSPPALVFSWRQRNDARQFFIRRREFGSGNWGEPIATLPGNATGYADTQVSAGRAYEYEVQCETDIPAGEDEWVNAYTYFYAGVDAALSETKGKALLLVDSAVGSGLEGELATYMQDLAGAGWTVARREVSRSASVTQIRDLVRAEYAADSSLRTVVLIGHVPVPYSGNIAPDLHETHRGAWPADMYYAELDGNWTDSSVNIISSDNPDNDNRPGDGKFDQSTPPSPVDLEIGRIDFWDLPAFSPRTELDLLRNYFRKNHEFRHRGFTAARQGLIRDNFGDLDGDAPAVDAWRHFDPFFGPGHVREAGFDNFFPTLNSESFLWAYGCGGGDYTKADGVGGTWDFAASDPKSVFLILHGSYFGDWNITDNFLRAAIASPSMSLASIWSGLPHWYLHTMALGGTIGEATRLSQNNWNQYKSHQNFAANEVHISLIGDPTLEMFPVMPPRGLSASAGSTVELNWGPSSDENLVGYHVYVSANANGPFQRLTAEPIAASTFSHAPGQGTFHYMVRAIKREVTGSGSFFNASQGVFATATTSGGGALPEVDISVGDGDAGETGANQGSFVISRTSVDASPLTVELIAGGTAQGGTDYAAIGSSVVIPGSQSAVTVVITPFPDDLVEGEETVIVQLRPSAAYTIGSPPSAMLKIVDRVEPPNTPPTAFPQVVQATQNTPVSLTLTGSDPEGATLAYHVQTPPVKGLLSGNAPALTYTPNPNASGSDFFTFTVSDGKNESAPARVDVEIMVRNQAPTALPQVVKLNEDSTVPITLTGSDPEGAALAFEITVQPGKGSLSGYGRTYVYTPSSNYFGADSFEFEVFDGELKSAAGTVSIEVTPVNDPPAAFGQALETVEGQPKSFRLTGSDPESDPLTYRVAVPPAKGQVTGTLPNGTYVPGPNASGTDFFTFVVSDGESESQAATVNISVTVRDDAPVALSQSVTVLEDQSKTVLLAGMDPEGQPLSFAIVAPPANGTLEGVAPNLTYRPHPNFNGADAIGFVVSDGTLTSQVAMVSISIAPQNDPPAATPVSAVTNEDQPVQISLQGTDPDGDALTFRITTPPAMGELTGTAPNLIYRPHPNASGQDTFSFVVNDGVIDSSPATVDVHLSPVNDLPTISIIPSQVLAKNKRSAPIPFTVDDLDQPISGLTVQARTSDGSIIAAEEIQLTGEGDERFVSLRPAANVTGNVTITLVVSDGQASSESKFTVAVINTPPVPSGDELEVLAGGYAIPAAALLANDTDADGDELSLSFVTPGAAGGTVSLRDNVILYTAPAGVSEDTFSYTLMDTSGAFASATVRVRIASAPVITSIQAEANGTVRLTLKGLPQSNFRVMSSADLSSWTLHGQGSTDADGVGVFSASRAPSVKAQFYRVEW